MGQKIVSFTFKVSVVGILDVQAIINALSGGEDKNMLSLTSNLLKAEIKLEVEISKLMNAKKTVKRKLKLENENPLLSKYGKEYLKMAKTDNTRLKIKLEGENSRLKKIEQISRC